MHLRRYEHASDFLREARTFLIAREAEHCVILGLAQTLIETPGEYPSTPYLAVATDGDRVVATAFRTPPYNLVLSEVDDPAAVSLFVDDLGSEVLTGVVGPVDHVRRFAEGYAARAGVSQRLRFSERVFRLTAVRPPKPVPGLMRPATSEDRAWVLAGVEGFFRDALGEDDPSEVVRHADRWLAGVGRTLFLWVDGDTVSMCGINGRTPNGIRISFVYTPPAVRQRGYASALVAAVSQAQLDAGRRFCFLFTDLANPTSNHIYQEIGYEPVRDVDEYRFERSWTS